MRRLLAALLLGLSALAMSAPADATATATASPQARPTPVLGSPDHLAPNGLGWGTVEPDSVFNGGDPSGTVNDLTWTGWGSRRAFGAGLNPLFRPGGGYYRKQGHILLRAQDLGTCADGTYGYRHLWFRVAHRPDGPLGKHWHRWGGDGDLCSRY